MDLFKEAPPPPREPGQPWPIAEAATFLRISARTLKNAEKIGTIYILRFGNRLHLADEEVKRIATEGLATKGLSADRIPLAV